MFVMGTGSRSMVTNPNRKTIYEALRRRILMIREAHPDLILISGMAEGWDEAIAKIGMREGIPYHAYIPNMGYGRHYWGWDSMLGRDRIVEFRELVEGASEVVIVCESMRVNGVHSNFLRNQAMVDACNMALVYMPESRGTADAVKRLIRAGKPYEVYPFI